MYPRTDSGGNGERDVGAAIRMVGTRGRHLGDARASDVGAVRGSVLVRRRRAEEPDGETIRARHDACRSPAFGEGMGEGDGLGVGVGDGDGLADGDASLLRTVLASFTANALQVNLISAGAA